jgi:hypothetical protein
VSFSSRSPLHLAITDLLSSLKVGMSLALPG